MHEYPKEVISILSKQHAINKLKINLMKQIN
jgi:hypothetical protein